MSVITFFNVVNSFGQSVSYDPVTKFSPLGYVCYRASAEITIDGKLSEEEWGMVEWTSDFIDIEGDKRPKPHYLTRVKMVYDDKGLYFAALLEEPHVWATITEHDAVIFHDNDFEIFIDPANSTHNYLEYEVNALGTYWDLYLTKPYRDGPAVLDAWELAGIKSAVYVDGTLNNPNDTDKSWSVEVFIPWTTINQASRKPLPEKGEHIRVNFSRVQWETKVENGKYVKIPMPGETKIREYNWVWASTDRIDIHRPEFWGFVQLSDIKAGEGTECFILNQSEDVKWLLRNLYYRQGKFRHAFGQYASSLSELKAEEICSQEQLKHINIYTTPSFYEITFPSQDGDLWHIRQDGLVWKTTSR